MISIHLNNLHFFSYHGIYPEEKMLGNDFEVQLKVEIEAKGRIESLDQTIDYVSLYQLVKIRMAIPTALLETLVQEIIDDIQVMDSRILSIFISIQKMNPLIKDFSGHVGVSSQWKK